MNCLVNGLDTETYFGPTDCCGVRVWCIVQPGLLKKLSLRSFSAFCEIFEYIQFSEGNFYSFVPINLDLNKTLIALVEIGYFT